MKWNQHEETVKKLIEEGKNLKQIAEAIGTTEYNVHLFIHRNRLFKIKHEGRNLAYEIIKIKFIHPEYFRPTKKFYQAVKITQRRWWALYRGDEKMTEEEYKNIASHLGLTLQEAFNARQINWLETV